MRSRAPRTRRAAKIVASVATTIAAGSVLAPGAAAHHPVGHPVAAANAGERVPQAVADALGGEVSVTPDDLYEVRTRSGRRFTTHGPDHAGAPGGFPDHGSALTPGQPERSPVCAEDPSSDYYTEFLYAYRSGEPNRIDHERSDIQAVVRRMNWLLDAESVASGGTHADLVVRCSEAGEIKVSAFPIPGSMTFDEIITAASDAGFANERVDYSILLDGPIGDGVNIAGIATYSGDDRLTADNSANNPPGSGADYAATAKDFWHTYVPLHELGHTQGAVQPTSPGASGSNFGHTNAAGDVMSYAGPGTCGGLHPDQITHHFDCGWNTYFDSAPEPGEWLANHWNLGSPLNRFIEFTPIAGMGTISGVVHDRASGTPLEGVAITVTGGRPEAGARTRRVHTDDAGRYSVPHVPEGVYSVSAERWGHRATTRTVVVKAGLTADGGFGLMELPRQNIGGTVMSENQRLDGAIVAIEGTPLGEQITEADGTFSFEGVPSGEYRFVVQNVGCAEPQTFKRRVGGKETFDFDLRRKSDAHGHTCVLQAAEWVDGTTPLTFAELDNASAAVTLPFTFSHYGIDYDTLHVSTNGHLSFAAPSAEGSNTPIPSPASPNASLYPFWDDLWLMDPAQQCPSPASEPTACPEVQVRTATLGTAPTRRFVVEYNNVQSLFSRTGWMPSWDFEVVLHEAGPGSVLFQYRGLGGHPAGVAPYVERGVSATIGIENADGSDALQVSFNTLLPGASESAAILFRPPAGTVGF